MHDVICERSLSQHFSIAGENGPSHQSECPILAGWKSEKLDFTTDNFILELMAILPLRLLNLSVTNPELSQRVNLLMDHLKDMGKDEKKVWEVSSCVLCTDI